MTVPSPAYSDRFFDYISAGSTRSAAVVVPLVLKHFPVTSLADIGCGRGAWLAQWGRSGVSDYAGIDGDYIERATLLIPSDRFIERDLSKPFDLGRRFDMIVSLEVAEHIRPEATEVFVDNLCRHADAILFSAATPGQGGLHHVNERDYGFWRDRFAAQGYRLFDFVRPAIVGMTEVEPWYRYNSLFFARGDAVARLSDTAAGTEIGTNESVPNRAPLNWRLRNALLDKMPASWVQGLVGLKHWYATMRSR